jgi:hypothetical protein
VKRGERIGLYPAMTTIQYAGFVVAGLVIGGGLVNASTTPAVIQACADNTNGALRLGTRCHSSETAVSWNQQGVQGAQGPQGPSSAKAIVYDGPVEASHVQSPSVCGPFGENPLPYVYESKCYWHSAAVGSIGPGDHVVNAKAVVVNTDQDDFGVRCELHTNAYASTVGPVILDHAHVWPSYDYFEMDVGASVSLAAGFENSSWTQHPLYVTCRGYFPFEVHDIKVNVITVGNVTSVALP